MSDFDAPAGQAADKPPNKPDFAGVLEGAAVCDQRAVDGTNAFAGQISVANNAGYFAQCANSVMTERRGQIFCDGDPIRTLAVRIKVNVVWNIIFLRLGSEFSS